MVSSFVTFVKLAHTFDISTYSIGSYIQSRNIYVDTKAMAKAYDYACDKYQTRINLSMCILINDHTVFDYLYWM